MEAVSGVFRSRRAAERAIDQLRSLGIPEDRVGLITPGSDGEQVEASVPVTDTEEPGMGKAMGATVGGAVGAAGGTTLGLAVASLAVPGIGPILAFGMVGAAVLGVVGAAAGAAVGDKVEEELGEGVPHEDVYLYEDALGRGYSILVAYVEDDDQADKAKEIINTAGAEDVEELRENWWRERREGERSHYKGDFDRDEAHYRRGYQAALDPRRRGKAYDQVEQDLRTVYGAELDTAFREGYERGLAYRVTVTEIRKR